MSHIPMLVTSQLSIETTKLFCSVFDVHLCPPLWKRFRHPCLQCNILHSCKSERHFRSKNQAFSHGARHSRTGSPSFLCPSL